MFQLQRDDRLFEDSPDAGDGDCICSRCGALIPERDMPIRVFVNEGRGGEYRFHPHCVGIQTFNDPELDREFGDDDPF